MGAWARLAPVFRWIELVVPGLTVELMMVRLGCLVLINEVTSFSNWEVKGIQTWRMSMDWFLVWSYLSSLMKLWCLASTSFLIAEPTSPSPKMAMFIEFFNCFSSMEV